MKQMQLTPPLLIITMGYPGAGKTFFARQFADQFELPRISEDVIRFELFENPVFNNDEADIIERVMHYTLDQLLLTKNTIVYEGMNLTLATRNRIYARAQKQGYRTLTVWVQTDITTSASRAAKRDRRNQDSKYSFDMEKHTFAYLKDQLERPSEKEPAVIISGKHAFKSQSLTILKKVTSMYAEQMNAAGAVPKPIESQTQMTRSSTRIVKRSNHLIQ